MDFFARWRNSAVTFYVFGSLKIIYIDSIDLPGLSRCLHIDVRVEAFWYLVLQFKFVVEIAAIVLTPKIVEVVESIVLIGTNGQLIARNIWYVVLGVNSRKFASYTPIFAIHGSTTETASTIGIVAWAALASCVFALLDSGGDIGCSSGLLCHELGLFGCIRVVQHFHCCLCSRLVRLRIQLMQVQFSKCL